MSRRGGVLLVVMLLGCRPAAAPVVASKLEVPASIAHDAKLSKLKFEAFTTDGVQGWVARSVVAGDAFGAWTAARAHRAETGLQPVLVDPRAVSPSDTPLPPLPPFDRDAFVAARRTELAKWPPSARMANELPTAVPQPEPYEEKLAFADAAFPVLALVLLPEQPWELVRHFGPDDEELSPKADEVAGMTHRWHERWGAEPIFVDNWYMELHTERQPATLDEQRALATELYATCPSDRESRGNEPAARLLTRLLAPHWVCWWFVE